MSEPGDEPHVLLTLEQAAQRCQVSLPKLTEWSVMQGFPIIRGPHFVRIHARLLEQWLGDFASATNPLPPQPRYRQPMTNGRKRRERGV